VRLEARDISVRFRGLVAVDGVSITVTPGEIVGLIGPNGAGKTTLLGALSGFVAPDEGSVHLDGQDVGGWTPDRLATAGLARTFQRLELFRHMTVHDNLLVAAEARFGEADFILDILGRTARRREAERLATVVMQKLALAELAGRWADEVPLGVGRLVEVGRALCTKPHLLLLDEPASGLDEGETDRLADALAGLADDDGMGILLVEHDLELVMDLCDRVAVMDFGKLIAEGDPDQVRRDPAVRQAYFGTTTTEVTGRGAVPVG
jgi:branched-chain amino acid transport system ATP-binding protein